MRAALLALALSLLTPPQVARLPVPGGELAYEVAGPSNAPAVVFLHGAFMDRGSWDLEFPVLARDFRVVRYDIRPFGESTRPEKAYSVPDDLLRLLDHLKIERPFLIGHSFGGALAIDFALLHPERVAGLVLIAAPPNGFVGPEDERKAAGAVFAAVKNGDDAIVKAWLDHPIWTVSRTRPETMKALEAITRRNLAPFHMTFAPYIPVTPPAVDRLADIKAPTLVLIGDRDTAGNRQGAELVASKVSGATLRVIAGADHGLPVGWADEVAAASVGFIRAARR
jgi:pimeloyl-ACP methyl ester carboxylesterase